MIHGYLPVPRRNLRISNLTMIEAVRDVAESDCKSRVFGTRHTIHIRLRRWAEAGALDRLFAALREHRLIRSRVECPVLISTSVKARSDGIGAPQKGPQAIGTSGGTKVIWLLRIQNQP